MIKHVDVGITINISPASSEIPLSKVFTYGISKAGMNNMTRFLAREWAPDNIRVNAIMPGFFPAEQNRKILTEERRKSIFGHTPMGRYGEAEELSGEIGRASCRERVEIGGGAGGREKKRERG